MDLQILPDLNVPEEMRKKWEEKMSRIVKEHERTFEEWYSLKLKAGYTKEEIERMICY